MTRGETVWEDKGDSERDSRGEKKKKWNLTIKPKGSGGNYSKKKGGDLQDRWPRPVQIEKKPSGKVSKR